MSAPGDQAQASLLDDEKPCVGETQHSQLATCAVAWKLLGI
jgi:hypothetical protein